MLDEDGFYNLVESSVAKNPKMVTPPPQPKPTVSSATPTSNKSSM
jgi:hypothetical protein